MSRSAAARLPFLAILLTAAAMLLHGPIPQLAHYHEFADVRTRLGVPNFADVMSNLGFAVVGLWGLTRLAPARREPGLARGWAGYRLFLVALVLTAVGSGYYHLAPDNARLLWDRLPIALACAGLLAAVRAETSPRDTRGLAAALTFVAVLSVAYWRATDLLGLGDLRPYLLLQFLPLVLIPLWQWLGDAPRAERRAFGLALALYAVAKLAELHDHELLHALGGISGHTLKHLLATAAAGVLVLRLTQRIAPRATQHRAMPILR